MLLQLPIGSEDALRRRGRPDRAEGDRLERRDARRRVPASRRSRPAWRRRSPSTATSCSRRVAEHDETLLEKYLAGEPVADDADQARRCARRRSARSSCRSCAAPPSRTRACSRCSTRWSTSCRRRSTCRRSRASIRRATTVERRPQPRRAVRRARVQDHDRPVRRPARLRARLLGHAQGGPERAATRPQERRERVGRILQMHANTREDIESISAGDIAALVGLKKIFTGDTLCAEHAPVVLESIDFPDPVIEIVIEPKTKADQDKLSEALAQARDRGSVVPRAHQRGDGSDPDLRPGRAAPRDHRRPPAARVPGAGERRQAAGRLQGDDHAARARGRQVRAPVGRQGPVRPRRARGRAARARQGHRVRDQGRRAAACRASTSSRSSRACARRCRPACSPASRSSTSGCGWSTARTTRSTRRSSRSRSPRRWA